MVGKASLEVTGIRITDNSELKGSLNPVLK